MLATIIPTRVHSILDYLYSVLFLTLPHLRKWDQPTTILFTTLGMGVIGYSLITRYELSLFRLIPLRVHLVIDILIGLFLILAPFVFNVFNRQSNEVNLWLMILGLIVLVVGLRTTLQFQERDRVATAQTQDANG